MNQQHYRTSLPHQIQQVSCGPVQAFAGGRFPGPNPLEALNPMIPPPVAPVDTSQYHAHLQPFLTQRGPGEQLLKAVEQGKTLERGFAGQAATPEGFHCSQGAKNCLQCYNKAQSPQQRTQTISKSGKLMVDAATMTDLEEVDPSWQNSSVPPNAKVAEYLTSLRQFLKLSNPPEKKRRQLGDVRIVTSSDGSRLYCCPECHMAYPDKSLLEPHLASHKIERRFVCGVCGAGLKRKEHLDRHQLSHSEERPYSCAACPKTFKRNEHLQRHYVVHTGEKRQPDMVWPQGPRSFVCTVCGTRHERREHLERHLCRHSDDRPHVCAVCSRGFKRTEHLARHLVTHTGHKPHGCGRCGKSFYRRDHLIKHLSSHQPRPPASIGQA